VTSRDDEERWERRGDGKKEGERRLPPAAVRSFSGNEYYVGKITGVGGAGYELPGFKVELVNVKTGEKAANRERISWARYKEFGWDKTGKLGSKEVRDLRDFLRACTVVRHAAHGEEEVEWTSAGGEEEAGVLYKSEAAGVDGKTCVVTVTGGFNTGLVGLKRDKLSGWGREGGVFVDVRTVWEGELREMRAEVGFNDLRRSGYKGGWALREDEEKQGKGGGGGGGGELFWRMEHRFLSRLLKNLVFCWSGGDESDKRQARLEWISGKRTIYKNAGSYVGGEYCSSSFFLESPGVIKVRCVKAKSGEVGEICVNEGMLVEKGWLELAGNIANSSEAGLKKFLDAVYFDGERRGALLLRSNGKAPGGEDVNVSQTIYKSAMRVEKKVRFVKVSTYWNQPECPGIQGDDGLVFDLTPWGKREDGEGGGGGGGGGETRYVISRQELEQVYGVTLMKSCGLGKGLARLPRHTIAMLLGKLRQSGRGTESGRVRR